MEFTKYALILKIIILRADKNYIITTVSLFSRNTYYFMFNDFLTQRNANPDFLSVVN